MITHWCIIRNKSIVCDNQVLFAGRQASLADFLMEAYASLKIEYPKFYKMDALSKLGFLAAEVLLRNQSGVYRPEQVSLVLSNTSSSLDTDIRFQESAKTMASPALFVYTLPNIVAGEICIRHKIKGENAFFVSPRFDAAWMSEYVSRVLEKPETRICLAGWVEVLEEHHDVFLYLTDKNEPSLPEHLAEQLTELYTSRIWNN